MENIAAHEHDLTRYAMQRLGEIEGMHIYGTPLSTMQSGADIHDAVISFNIQQPSSNLHHTPMVGTGEGLFIHHLDLGTLLDRLGIAVRTGHHCAQPLMDRLGILGTVRASFALYNTREEVDVLAKGIARVAQMF